MGNAARNCFRKKTERKEKNFNLFVIKNYILILEKYVISLPCNLKQKQKPYLLGIEFTVQAKIYQ